MTPKRYEPEPNLSEIYAKYQTCMNQELNIIRKEELEPLRKKSFKSEELQQITQESLNYYKKNLSKFKNFTLERTISLLAIHAANEYTNPIQKKVNERFQTMLAQHSEMTEFAEKSSLWNGILRNISTNPLGVEVETLGMSLVWTFEPTIREVIQPIYGQSLENNSDSQNVDSCTIL